MKAGSCTHPDCIYRNTERISANGQCDYLRITGHSRIKGLPPEQQKPENCPRYESGKKRRSRNASMFKVVERKDPAWWATAEVLYRAGQTDAEIAAAMGKAKETVRNWRDKHLKAPPHPSTKGKGPRYDWDRAAELYRQGMTDPQIAAALGCAANAVWIWRKRNELPSNYRKKKVEDNETV